MNAIAIQRKESDKAVKAATPLAVEPQQQAGEASRAVFGVPRFLESGAMQGQVEVGSDVDPLEQEADEFAQAAGHYAPVVPRFLARACASPLYRGADGQKVPALEKPGLSPEAGPVGRLRLRGDPPNDGCDADNHCDRTTVRSSVTREDTAEPLAASVRARLEDSLGLDLGSVQIHRGPATSRAAAELHAKAFAHGRDIWLGAGQRSDDFGLMAHEVAHVVQQSDQQGPIRRRGNADASPETGAGDEADPSRQTFGFSEDEMESRLAGTPAEGADTSAPTVEPGASTESTLSEVEGEGGEEGAGEPATADERGQAQAEAEGGERGEGRAGRGARRSGSGDGQGRPSAPEVPGPASAFENLVGADVAAYLDGNLSDERLAALDPQTQALLEAANLLGDRSITDPEASVLQGLAGEGLQPGVSTTGYEGEPGWLRTLARVRDITGQLGGIVGIIGLACMVAGFILSLLVWPVGAFLLTVGRFCDIAAVILDGISLALGLILTRYNYYRLKNETNPEERRRLLGMVRQNAMGTVMSGIAVATAVAPGAGRLLGRAGRRVSRGIRTVSRRGGTLGRGARALRLAGVARRSAMRAGRRRIAAAGSSVASGFRRLSQSSSLPGRAARSVSTAYGVGARALGATRSAVGGWGMRQLGRARGTMPVRWANRVGGRAEDWMRRSGRNLATRNTVMGRFYNRRLRGFHERNVMLARSINDPVERAYQLRLGQQLTDELNKLRQANPGWSAKQLDDRLRADFGRERYGDAQVGTTKAGNKQFVREDKAFLHQVRETEFAEIQLIRDRLPPSATPRDLAEAVNHSPFIKGRWTEAELDAFSRMNPTVRGASGELALRDAGGLPLAVAKTGHHTLPAGMAPQISRDPRFIQIVNDSRSYRKFIDRAHPGMLHVSEVKGYMVPGKRKDLVQAENSREVLLDMLDKGKIHGYKPADIDYFMGRGLADDLVADGSSGVWRNRRTPGQQVFFNPHFGIGHQWDWDNELARQIFDMNSRLGLSLRRELGAQALMPAIRQELRTSADAPATGDREGAADERTQTLIDQSIQSRAQTHQGFSPSAAIDAWLEPVALPAEEPTSDQSALPNNDELNELLPSAAAESVEMPAVAAEEAWGEPWMEPESSAAAGEATEVPPSPVPYSPQSLVSIREQRIAIAEAICVVNDYIADAQQAESHNRDAQDAATSLMERNTEQCDFAQSERDTVAGEQDRLTQAGDAQQQMTADNERASGEADRGQDEADTVKSKGQNVTVEPKPEEPRQRSWLERAWDATGGALWNNLIAPAVRVVRRKFNQVMNSINTFIMDMINQALGLDEIEKELNGGREDIAARDASLDETGAGLQETQDQAVAEEERNQQSVDQADANIADAVTTREDTQALMAELQAHDQVLLAEEMEGQAYVVDFGSRYEPFFAAEGATAAEGETVDVLAGVEPLATTTAPEPGTEESDETALT